MTAFRTPLISPLPNLRVKLEHLNPGGSHKARAARHIICKAIADGELKPGGSRRIIEKSGGNFGIGLGPVSVWRRLYVVGFSDKGARRC